MASRKPGFLVLDHKDDPKVVRVCTKYIVDRPEPALFQYVPRGNSQGRVRFNRPRGSGKVESSRWSSLLENPKVRWDLWTLPAYLLWLVFFLVGFDPEMAYDFAREIGFVVSQNALVNSPHIVTLSLAGYIGYFAYSRCLESGLSKADAQTQGLQFSILGLIAFLAFSPFQLISYAEIPVAKLRFVVLLVGGTKLFMWFLLLGVVARYYLLGHVHVFASMVSAFPSAHREEGTATPADSTRVAWLDVRPRGDSQAAQPASQQRPETGTEP